MRSLLSIVALVGLAAAAPRRWHQLNSEYSFEEYTAAFGKKYSDSEFSMRKALFQQRLEEAMEHNLQGSSWKKGINHMSDWTPAEQRALLGRVAPTSSRVRMAKLDTSVALPPSKDWRDDGVVTPVKDQGQCGSCWAFATTEVVESHLAIQTGILDELSPQNLVACVRNPDHCGGFGGCQGATAELGLDYIKENGIASPYSFPYESHEGTTNGTCFARTDKRSTPVANITGTVQLPANDETALITALATQGPVAVSVAASEWSSYESGIYDGCATTGAGTDIDHAVVAVGYDEESIIIRNSWTPRWGEKGYIRLRRTTQCGIDTTPSDGYACDNGPKQIKVCGMCGVLSDSVYPTGTQFA